MSYLNLTKGIPDFSQAVISLWFRAPKEAVVAASTSKLSAGAPDFYLMQGVLPLITFGKPQQNKNYVADPRVNVANDVSGTNPGAVNMEIPGYTAKTPYDVDPCLIGLIASSDGTFNVGFNIQTGVEMVTSSTTYVTTRVDHYDHSVVPPPYTGPLGENGWSDNYTQYIIEDASYADNDQPQFFFIGSREGLKPDEWHHVLVSFDVGGPVLIGRPFASSACRLWYAIDDKDYRGQDNMGPYRGASSGGGTDIDGLGDNTIVTHTAWRQSFPAPAGGFHYNNWSVSPPSGSYAAPDTAIPTEDQPIGIPAAVKYVDGIFQVEMAEFQMWTGITLDTGVESSRRAFIDYERDDNGNPIKDNDGNLTLVPVPPAGGPPSTDHPDGVPAPAEELLEKKPEILLHGSSKWIDGENTGTTGVDYSKDPPEVKPEGQFQPTGKINPYTPDPSLSKSAGSSIRRKAGPVRLTKKPAANARL